MSTKFTFEQFVSAFWEKVTPEPNSGCFLWCGAADKLGYGRVKSFWRKGAELTHRVAYTITKGEIPAGLVLDHKCRNPSCVNPDHLEAVTQRENLRRGPSVPSTLAAQVTHCPQGHEYTPENTSFSSRGHRRCRACAKSRQPYLNEWRRRDRAMRKAGLK